MDVAPIDCAMLITFWMHMLLVADKHAAMTCSTSYHATAAFSNIHLLASLSRVVSLAQERWCSNDAAGLCIRAAAESYNAIECA